MKNYRSMQLITGILLIILGLVMVFCGISEMPLHFYPNYEYNKSYGGDAYTGIQNAAAATANNVAYLGHMMESYCNFTFIFGGLFIVILGIGRLVPAVDKKNNAPKETAVATAPVQPMYQAPQHAYTPQQPQPMQPPQAPFYPPKQ